MILIDFNNLAAGSIVAQTNHGKLPINIDEFRTYFLNGVRNANNQFRSYGNIAIICDHRSRPWRKDVFPYYKATRDKQKSYTNLDWTLAYKAFDQIKQELRESMPYRVVEVENAEGDDIIGTLTIHRKEPMAIISSDSDFKQLHAPDVVQYSILHGKVIDSSYNKIPMSAKEYLERKILHGDRTDGIPNVLSDDDVFISPDKSQMKMTEKRVDQLLDPFYTKPTPVQKNYDRNKMLIDLTMIPKYIRNRIIETYIGTKPASRDKMFNYFVTKRLVNLMEHIQEF